MPCRPTVVPWRPSGITSHSYGGVRFGGAARRTASRGIGSPAWWTTGFPSRVSSTRGRACALPSDTQGGSRMRESRTYGFVRGAPRNGRPYRDLQRLHPRGQPREGREDLFVLDIELRGRRTSQRDPRTSKAAPPSRMCEQNVSL